MLEAIKILFAVIVGLSITGPQTDHYHSPSIKDPQSANQNQIESETEKTVSKEDKKFSNQKNTKADTSSYKTDYDSEEKAGNIKPEKIDTYNIKSNKYIGKVSVKAVEKASPLVACTDNEAGCDTQIKPTPTPTPPVPTPLPTTTPGPVPSPIPIKPPVIIDPPVEGCYEISLEKYSAPAMVCPI